MRAKNMQALTDAIKRRHPGVVIYGIGDPDHQLHSSDHNEDDTPGSKAAQSDSDSNPEHRAIDVMLGPNFTKADADKLVNDLVSDPASRSRLFNIIWNGGIWSRSWGWTRRAFGGDPHRDHPHISGWAADDENDAGWPAVEEDDMPLTDKDQPVIKEAVHNTPIGRTGKTVGEVMDQLRMLPGRVDSQGTKIDAIRVELAAVRTVVESLAEVIKAGGGSVDLAGISAKIDQSVAAAVEAIRIETRDAVADLGEGGASQVRAD